MKKAYIVPEALFIGLVVEDNTNNLESGLLQGNDDLSVNLDGDLGDLFN